MVFPRSCPHVGVGDRECAIYQWQASYLKATRGTTQTDREWRRGVKGKLYKCLDCPKGREVQERARTRLLVFYQPKRKCPPDMTPAVAKSLRLM